MPVDREFTDVNVVAPAAAEAVSVAAVRDRVAGQGDSSRLADFLLDQFRGIANVGVHFSPVLHGALSPHDLHHSGRDVRREPMQVRIG